MQTLLKKIDELQSKINDVRPLSKDHAESLREYYKIGTTWSSNALEGNTLTESETKVVLEDGLTIGGKSLREHLEASGHADAYDYMYTLLAKKEVSEKDVLGLHELFYKKIDNLRAGAYRTAQVFISGSQFPVTAPEKISQAMHKFESLVMDLRKNVHPVIAAAKAHKEFVFIHPFIDGNGRVARLIMNCILLQEGYTLSIIPPILRSRYIASLEKAHVDDTDFVTLICETVYETQKDYLRLLSGT